MPALRILHLSSALLRRARIRSFASLPRFSSPRRLPLLPLRPVAASPLPNVRLLSATSATVDFPFTSPNDTSATAYVDADPNSDADVVTSDVEGADAAAADVDADALASNVEGHDAAAVDVDADTDTDADVLAFDVEGPDAAAANVGSDTGADGDALASNIEDADAAIAGIEDEGLALPVQETSTAAAAGKADRKGHPWPEWERFLRKIKSKGFFDDDWEPFAPAKVGDGTLTAADLYATMEQNRIKNAALKFARERFDILRSLSKEDIRATVDGGCPNLYRKAVNSAKRLRAFLNLDEGDVCNECNLKGTCDKAYINPNENEGPRTVDVVRILMTYAINPEDLVSDNPPVNMRVQEAARKLLSELIELSDTSIDPKLSKPVFQSNQKKPSNKPTGNKRSSENVEMKKGDWRCSNCNFVNFGRNAHCLECKEEGPKKVDFEPAEMKLGDWTCPSCQFMNFSRNKACKRCTGSRPRRVLNPGEWECSSCFYLNFGRNKVCKKCDCDRPNDDASGGLDDHAWRKPKFANNTTFKFGGDDDDEEVDDDGILPLQEGENRLATSKRVIVPESSSKQWDCPSCEFFNFGKNKVCKSCNRPRPTSKSQFDDNVKRKPKSDAVKFEDDEDDYEEDDDDDMLSLRGGKGRFAASKRETPADGRLKAGDWDCPSCKFFNFARNKYCKSCNHARPNDKIQFDDIIERKRKPGAVKFGDDEDDDGYDENDLSPRQRGKSGFAGSRREASAEGPQKAGDWNCLLCGFSNFSRNKVCKKCSCDPPNHNSSQFEVHPGRRPKSYSNRSPSKYNDDENEFAGEDDDDDEDDILPLQDKFVSRNRATSYERGSSPPKKRAYSSRGTSKRY